MVKGNYIEVDVHGDEQISEHVDILTCHVKSLGLYNTNVRKRRMDEIDTESKRKLDCDIVITGIPEDWMTVLNDRINNCGVYRSRMRVED